MKYVKTVEANIWDSNNEAQIDKIVDWLGLSRPGMFDLDDVDGLVVQTIEGLRTVKDGDAIILDNEKNTIEVMNGQAFKTIYDLLVDE